MTNGYQFEVVPYEAAHGLDMAPDLVDQYAFSSFKLNQPIASSQESLMKSNKSINQWV